MTDYAPVDLELGDQVEFELNGRRVHAPPGAMLVDAAHANGVEIPVFCYEPRIGPALGACRMCLVEVEGMRGLQTACSTPVNQDMVVHTKSDQAVDGQDGVLELILANHPLDCPVCDKGGECPLQDRTFRFGPGESRFLENKRHFPKPLDLSSLIALDRERCISCFRCVRFSQEVAEDGLLTFQERGGDSEITTFTGGAYEGRFTGNIVDICPVGALTSIPYRFVARPWDVTNTESVCGTCPVGCNVELTTREGRVQRVSGREQPNWIHEEGWLSDKCRYSFPAAWSPDRLTTPLIRDGGDAREVSLEEAVAAASVLLARDDARPGVIVGPGATIEEGYLAQEIAQASGNAQIQQLGIPGEPLEPLRALPPAELADLDSAPLIVEVGGDPANQQAVVELRIRKALRHGARLVMIGARPHALTGLGEWHETAPGEIAATLSRLSDEIKSAEAPIFVWDEHCLSQEPDAVPVLAELGAALPQAKQLELGVHINGAGLRALGMPAAGVLEAAEAGRIGTLVSVHADPLAAPGASRWDAALAKTGPLVVVATHASELTDAANVVIPASMPTEHEGTLVSMNGRAQRLRPGQEPPEGAAPGWQILVAMAHRLGAQVARTPSTIMRAVVAERPALAGASYSEMDRLGMRLRRPPPGETNGVHVSREPHGDGLRVVTTRRIFGDAFSMRSEALAHVRQPADVVISPREAERLGLWDGSRARLVSEHGECVLPVRVSEAHQDGVAFVAVGVPGAGVERLLPADDGPVRVQLTPA